jgi:hypothetical protein
MAFVQVFSLCVQCGRTFAYNPNLVPSVRVNGVREPACRSCIEASNPIRIANGLPPWVIQPGAYEPADESEIDFGD